MDLMPIEARWWFGQIPNSKVPETALDLLEAGYDSPTLRQIAGIDDKSAIDLGTLFEIALKELGRSELSRDQAAKYLAAEICQEIVTGQLTPYEGARKIWWEIWENQRSLEVLRPFVGLVSEYEDDQSHRKEYSDDILKEASEFLQNQVNPS
jgi:hypothetical protein